MRGLAIDGGLANHTQITDTDPVVFHTDLLPVVRRGITESETLDERCLHQPTCLDYALLIVLQEPINNVTFSMARGDLFLWCGWYIFTKGLAPCPRAVVSSSYCPSTSALQFREILTSEEIFS